MILNQSMAGASLFDMIYVLVATGRSRDFLHAPHHTFFDLLSLYN